eukprot:scaffold248323_cov18-Tisochrysis_lutea.AAC.2
MHVQEGRVCSTSGGHVSNHLRTKRLESWDQELSTGTHMGPIGGGLLGASQGHTIQDPPEGRNQCAKAGNHYHAANQYKLTGLGGEVMSA